MAHHISLTIPFAVKKLWHEWNLRGAILFSLFLQIALILMGSIRKSVSQQLVIFLIWLAYLMASATANLAVGLISSSQRSISSSQRSQENVEFLPVCNQPLQSSDLLAFWAPFLLVHLGGPDTITAFALVDNQLWLRQFLVLCFQAGAVFFQSLPNENLRIHTVLMFIAGIIKSVERTRALYLASLDKFRKSVIRDPDPGPNYPKLMEEYAFKRGANLPTRIVLTSDPEASDVPPKEGDLNHLEVVHYAYKYFNTFKGLVVDLIFSFRERDDSRKFFIRRKAEDALRIIEVELNLLYGTFYTKVEVVYSRMGFFCRFLAFGSVLATLGLFYFQASKHELQGVDVVITYTLLLGAIAVDVIAFLMLIFSDRIFASVGNPDCPRGWGQQAINAIFSNFLARRVHKWQECQFKTCQCTTNSSCPARRQQVLNTSFLFRRWSGSISTHNLISYCLLSGRKTIHEFPSSNLCSVISKVTKYPWPVVEYAIQSLRSVYARKWNCPLLSTKKCYLPFKDFMDGLLYVSSEPFTLQLWEYIFEELKNKSEFADIPETAKRISSARGDWVLTDASDAQDQDQGQDRRNKLLKYVSDVPYDESLLLWHIATDLCYYDEEGYLADRDFSKILWDYMLYLLVFQPTIMSAVAGIGEIRYRDTCAEAEIFFRRWRLGPNQDSKACEEILKVNTDVEPVFVKGNRSKSVLFTASMLAKELKELGTSENKWKVISRVWVELISYAASHCRASTYAQPVSEGGELITFVWLLMAQLGLSEQFQIDEASPRAKLVVGD